jgi:hypothetical protein
MIGALSPMIISRAERRPLTNPMKGNSQCRDWLQVTTSLVLMTYLRMISFGKRSVPCTGSGLVFQTMPNRIHSAVSIVQWFARYLRDRG